MSRTPRVYSTPAIVLRQRRLGETDKILTLYTAAHGKLDAVVKGVRKTRSRLAGHVEPLTHGTFLLAHGRSLDVLTQAETIEPFGNLRADLDRMSRALYACELLDKFTEPRAENFRLYRLLLDTFRRIATLDDVDLPIRFFEMLLLDELGYRPELDACVVCRANVEPDAIYWSPGAGGVICANCRAAANTQRKLSANALKMLRLFRHAPYNHVARVRIDADLASELERVMVDYVRWVLERDVRTASFIQVVRKTSRAGRPAAPDARPS